MSSNTFLSKLTLYVDEVIGEGKCGIQHKRSATNQIFFKHLTLRNAYTLVQYISHCLFVCFPGVTTHFGCIFHHPVAGF